MIHEIVSKKGLMKCLQDKGFSLSVRIGTIATQRPPIQLKTAVSRELDLESSPETPIEWVFSKDSDRPNNPPSSGQKSSNSNLITVNMRCYWKNPVNEGIRGAGFYGFDKNQEPISNISPTDERGFTSFVIKKNRFPLRLNIEHPDARDSQQITISLQESDENVLPFKDCKFNRKEN